MTIYAQCNCISEANKSLERDGLNTRVDSPLRIDFITGNCPPPIALIATHKADTSKRGKAASIFASYCPLCGKKYTQKPLLRRKK